MQTRYSIELERSVSCLLLAGLVAGCSATGGGTDESSPASTRQAHGTAESPEARAVIDRLRAGFRRPALRGGSLEILALPIADRIDREGPSLHPHIPEAAARAVRRRASVALPRIASGFFELTDADTGLTVRVALVDATEAPGEVAGSYVAYRAAHASSPNPCLQDGYYNRSTGAYARDRIT